MVPFRVHNRLGLSEASSNNDYNPEKAFLNVNLNKKDKNEFRVGFDDAYRKRFVSDTDVLRSGGSRNEGRPPEVRQTDEGSGALRHIRWNH